jgi:site-specific recombinase XerD
MLGPSPGTCPSPLLSAVVPKFLLYARAELQFAPRSLVKYQDCLRQIQKALGDRPLDAYTRDDVLLLKSNMLARGLSVSRQVGILSALKRLLAYGRDHEHWAVLDPELVAIPKRPRREVIYLTAEEVARFVAVIPLVTTSGRVHGDGLRFRALVEALLGSAMRISELLSLDRAQVDFELREAKIVGKGNKERVVFFSARAIQWLRRYLDWRTDEHPALFVCRGGKSRLNQLDLWRPFARYRKRAGIVKPVTPHLLRHTAATQLLFNGCPVGHIKEILGHERLETTCRYYLGLDHRAAKQAHERFLVYPDRPGSLS